MSESIQITVSAKALYEVLNALLGPPHLIRELQATRDLPGLHPQNPIDTLVEQYNAFAKRIKEESNN